MEERVKDIQYTEVFNAPIEKVWKTVATAEGISSWFMPNDFESEVGHEFHIQSPFGPSPCKVLVVDEPNKLSFAWDQFGWIVTFELKEEDGKTHFTLTHGGWGHPDAILPKAQQKVSAVRDNMNGGWAKIMQSLKQTVEK
ncbi:SRPBCC domain-containing protein [Fictibacillus sp. KIGAM418]|uniref:SRPBCC domain-containing protein n=2 Tax=Fictibacillus marinisediminis TaxID=2878389 RepID=A0A9X1XAF5_9BACL|nr:SRPBCC domain-containing protein [Fictibacillus marinisediminis]MCK6256205.1 SRPBCC domain-containing protein [Fictibacillus marinisediminis]